MTGERLVFLVKLRVEVVESLVPPRGLASRLVAVLSGDRTV